MVRSSPWLLPLCSCCSRLLASLHSHWQALLHTHVLSLSLSLTHTHTRYYSERVRRLTYPWGCEFKHRANHANGTPLSDAAVREAADFGVFIE